MRQSWWHGGRRRLSSDEDAEGNQGTLIGTLPANTTIIDTPPPPEQTDQFTNTFNPKALVIFQDFSQENPNDPPQINRQYFSLEDPERARDGAYFSTGQDAPPPSGAFINAHYNPRTGDITHYYRDALTNRWIISTAPYQPNPNNDNLVQAAMNNRSPGSKFVFEWIIGQRRVLF